MKVNSIFSKKNKYRNRNGSVNNKVGKVFKSFIGVSFVLTLAFSNVAAESQKQNQSSNGTSSNSTNESISNVSVENLLSFESDASQVKSFESFMNEMLDSNFVVRSMNANKKYLRKKKDLDAVSFVLPTVRVGMKSGNGNLSGSRVFIRGEYDIMGAWANAYEHKSSSASLIGFSQGEYVEKLLKISTEAAESAMQYHISKKMLEIVRYFISFYQKICDNAEMEGASYMYSKAKILRAKSALAQNKTEEIRYMQTMENAKKKFIDMTGKHPDKVILFIDNRLSSMSEKQIEHLIKKNNYGLCKARASYLASTAQAKSATLKSMEFSVGGEMEKSGTRQGANLSISCKVFPTPILNGRALGARLSSEREKYKASSREAFTSAQNSFSEFLFISQRLDASKKYAESAYAAYVQEKSLFDIGGSSLSDLIKVMDDYLKACSDLYDVYVKYVSSQIRSHVEVFGMQKFSANYKSYVLQKKEMLKIQREEFKKLRNLRHYNANMRDNMAGSRVLAAMNKYNKTLAKKSRLNSVSRSVNGNMHGNVNGSVNRGMTRNGDVSHLKNLEVKKQKIDVRKESRKKLQKQLKKLEQQKLKKEQKLREQKLKEEKLKNQKVKDLQSKEKKLKEKKLKEQKLRDEKKEIEKEVPGKNVSVNNVSEKKHKSDKNGTKKTSLKENAKKKTNASTKENANKKTHKKTHAPAKENTKVKVKVNVKESARSAEKENVKNDKNSGKFVKESKASKHSKNATKSSKAGKNSKDIKDSTANKKAKG